MSVNFNNQVLKLSKNPVMDNSRSLFDRFTNPWNRSDLSLKETGTITAVFDKKAPKLINNGRELPCNDAAFLSQVVDPQGKLKGLIDQGKIAQIHGNCTVDQAQVILLDDVNHLDKEQGPLIRGEAANALKGKENVYICEACPSSKIFFNQKEINHYFAPNLVLNQDGSKDYLSGWDNSMLHKQSKEAVVRGCQQLHLSGFNSSSSTNFNNINVEMLVNGLVDLLDVGDEKSHLRTESLWHTIKEKLAVFPNAKIIVFSGGAHNKEKWLHEQLSNHDLRFVEITPPNFLEVTPEQVENYYGVKQHSIWGNKQ